MATSTKRIRLLDAYRFAHFRPLEKIRGIQRRAYDLRDEEYLRLKILTSMLPAL